jgi:hypothetical protein
VYLLSYAIVCAIYGLIAWLFDSEAFLVEDILILHLQSLIQVKARSQKRLSFVTQSQHHLVRPKARMGVRKKFFERLMIFRHQQSILFLIEDSLCQTTEM